MAIVEERVATGENLRKFSRAKATPEEKTQSKKMVAAYCRVSKKIEEQQTSIQTQMESYNLVISEHPDWELAGIYADKGKPGTSKATRPEFLRMVKDAMDGKIDMILVKSISRFSRNTLDMLETIRKLRDKGVGVYFEKEKLNSLSQNSEMLITVYSAFAQEESHSISENMKRGIRQRFEIGVPKWAEVYGYERVGKDEWAPKKGEAEIVAEIYDLYFAGKGAGEIAKILTGRGIEPPGGGEKWLKSSVADILYNEKYIGDCRMQKYFKPDFMKKTSVKNTEMVVDQYYKEGHHEAIVPREFHDYVPLVAAMRDNHRGAVQYPYYGKLICPFCGKAMVKVRIPAGGNTNAWVCGGENKGSLYTKRTKCKPYWVKEPYLSDAVKSAILQLEPWSCPVEVVDYIFGLHKRLRDGGKIEFLDLEKLVESITFLDWETLEVTWLWGEKTAVSYQTPNYVEAPDPLEKLYAAIERNEKKITDRTIESVEANVQRVSEIIKKTRIVADERPGYPPSIVPGYKVPKTKKPEPKKTEPKKSGRKGKKNED